MVVDADQLVKCSLCSHEAFVLAQWGGARPVPLCAECFARVEPEVMRAAREREVGDGPPVQLIRRDRAG